MDAYEDLQQATLHDIPRSECLQLLGVARVGRIVFADDEGPVALPVNFRMDGESVLFRVSPASEMCLRLNEAKVSFQVDRLATSTRPGGACWCAARRRTSRARTCPS